ncbi:helix-turn-helix domain-containing protein [Bifidobacterium aquikefiri]|uniref:helix-turn-helix domain-containing protein n=1 Tax=Bifidobacterium aquikefiri TaxID=1653207 RepID=UPI0039EBC596
MRLHRSLSNQSVALKSLISRTLHGKRAFLSRPSKAVRSDVRGHVVDRALKTQTRLSYPSRQKVLAAYADGTPVKEIVSRFGICRSTIWKIVTSAGQQTRNHELSPAVQEEVRRLYESGLTLAEITKKLGVGRVNARAIIISEGGTMRSRGRRHK